MKTKILSILALLLAAVTQGAWAQEPATTYKVTVNDGNKDAKNWTITSGQKTATGDAADGLTGVSEGDDVTLTYSGRLKVKSVTATTDAAPAVNPNAYLKWDATKKELVETEIPATVTNVANANADVTWEAGTYVVDGEVTINGTITLNGAVDLIVKDGAKLTVNNQIAGNDKNLSIYGQANQTGQLVVNSSGDAIKTITTLEVHSCQVTATSSGYGFSGFSDMTTFNVYGGSVDAENTGTIGYGIYFASNGSMNIYGGDVKAVGKGESYGITGLGAPVTVYGGKLWAECAGYKAFYAVELQKGEGFTGKIETSDNGSSWTEYTEDGTPGTKYVRVGY
jgi:hypothetical protein